MQALKKLLKSKKLPFVIAAYLLILAVAVMYLRVTISVPPEGDDKLTLNEWLFDFEHMPFWQYLLKDLRWRLDFFTLREFRFFPFHYPSALSLLFFGTLASYRMYIILVTALAAALVSRVAASLTKSEGFALAAFALALSMAPIFNEGMYSYYAVPQKALAWAAASWLCLLRLQSPAAKHRKLLAVAAGVFAFCSCGTYEIGYLLTVAGFLLFWLQSGRFFGSLRAALPGIVGTGVAFAWHTAAQALSDSVYSGNTLGLNLVQAPRVLVQQMAASLPFFNPLCLRQPYGAITKGDMLWPLLLGLAAAVFLFLVPRKTAAKPYGQLAVFGLLLWAFPALLLAVSQRYQEPEAITWKWGYIPAAASSIGLGLLVAALLGLLVVALDRLPKVPAALLRLVLAAVLSVALCANGAYTRACLRENHAFTLGNYEFFKESVAAGLADEVTADDLILSNESVWDTNEEAEGLFFSRWSGRRLYARCMGDTSPADIKGSYYAYQTYRHYGGYSSAWCGKLQGLGSNLMDGMRVYVQSAWVPNNGLLKYRVLAEDGSEQSKSISLLDLDQSPRDEHGDYFVFVYDKNIINDKVMLWARPDVPPTTPAIAP